MIMVWMLYLLPVYCIVHHSLPESAGHLLQGDDGVQVQVGGGEQREQGGVLAQVLQTTLQTLDRVHIQTILCCKSVLYLFCFIVCCLILVQYIFQFLCNNFAIIFAPLLSLLHAAGL